MGHKVVIQVGTLAAALILAALPAQALPRSAAAVAEFRRTHPCPVTGQARGACPGWQVDHIDPLKCGGADRPANMQWLTVDEHKRKTAHEARWCKKNPPPKRGQEVRGSQPRIAAREAAEGDGIPRPR